jgi:hypothetical protein
MLFAKGKEEPVFNEKEFKSDLRNMLSQMNGLQLGQFLTVSAVRRLVVLEDEYIKLYDDKQVRFLNPFFASVVLNLALFFNNPGTVRTRSVDLDIDIYFARAKTITTEVDLDIARARANAIDKYLSRARAISIDLDLAMDFNITKTRAIDLVMDFDLARNRSTRNKNTRDKDRETACATALKYSMLRDAKGILEGNFVYNDDPMIKHDFDSREFFDTLSQITDKYWAEILKKAFDNNLAIDKKVFDAIMTLTDKKADLIVSENTAITSTLDKALARATAFAFALERIRDAVAADKMKSELIKAQNRAKARAKERAKARKRAVLRAKLLARALARSLALALDLALARIRDRKYAQTLARAYALALSRALTRNLSLAKALALDLAMARDLDLDTARDLAVARDLVKALDIDLARDLVHARKDLDLSLAHQLALDLDITTALGLARDITHELELDVIGDLDLACERQEALIKEKRKVKADAEAEAASFSAIENLHTSAKTEKKPKGITVEKNDAFPASFNKTDTAESDTSTEKSAFSSSTSKGLSTQELAELKASLPPVDIKHEKHDNIDIAKSNSKVH